MYFTLLQAGAGETVTPAPNANDLIVLSGDLDDGRHVLRGVRRHDDVRKYVGAEAIVNDPTLLVSVSTPREDPPCDGIL